MVRPPRGVLLPALVQSECVFLFNNRVWRGGEKNLCLTCKAAVAFYSSGIVDYVQAARGTRA